MIKSIENWERKKHLNYFKFSTFNFVGLTFIFANLRTLSSSEWIWILSVIHRKYCNWFWIASKHFNRITVKWQIKSDDIVCKQRKRERAKKMSSWTYRSWLCFQIYILTKKHISQQLNFLRTFFFEAHNKAYQSSQPITINDSNQKNNWWFNVQAELWARLFKFM